MDLEIFDKMEASKLKKLHRIFTLALPGDGCLLVHLSRGEVRPAHSRADQRTGLGSCRRDGCQGSDSSLWYKRERTAGVCESPEIFPTDDSDRLSDRRKRERSHHHSTKLCHSGISSQERIGRVRMQRNAPG